MMICDAVDGGCGVDGVENWRRSEVDQGACALALGVTKVDSLSNASAYSLSTLVASAEWSAE